MIGLFIGLVLLGLLLAFPIAVMVVIAQGKAKKNVI